MSKGKANRVVNDVIGETWEPRQSDIDWLRNMLTGLNNGGKWAVPMNGQTYVVDHTNKTFNLITGHIDPVFHRTRAIAAKLGYRVMDKTGQSPEQSGEITVTECGVTS